MHKERTVHRRSEAATAPLRLALAPTLLAPPSGKTTKLVLALSRLATTPIVKEAATLTINLQRINNLVRTS